MGIFDSLFGGDTGGTSRSLWDTLSSGISSGINDNRQMMRMGGLASVLGADPNQVLQSAMLGSGMDDKRKARTAETAQKNKTLQYLQTNRPDLAAQVEAGLPMTEAFKMLNQKPEVAKPTSLMQNYEYAKQNGYQGSIMDYQLDLKRAGATNVNVGDGSPGLGKLSTDYGYIMDPQTGKPKIDPATGMPQAAAVPGSPAALKIQQEQEQGAQQNELAWRAGNVVLEDIRRVKSKIKNSSWSQPTAGFMGSILKDVAGTQAADVKAMTTTIKANIGFDRLQQMREASPTGGALGQVSNQEISNLQAVLGNLEQSQSEEQLLYNLDRLETIYSDIMRKAAAYPNASQYGFGGQQQTQGAQQTDPLGIR